MSDENNKVGRPSSYTPEIQAIADDYVNGWDLYKEIKNSDGSVTTVVNAIPSVAGLALTLGVHRSTIYNWIKDKNRQFLDTLEIIKQKQEVFLIHHGLTRGYDSGFAKFLAINVTDYKDKVEQTIDHKNIQINIDSNDSKL